MDDNPTNLPLPRARASAVLEIDFGAGRLNQVRLFCLHFFSCAAQSFALPVQHRHSRAVVCHASTTLGQLWC